MAQQMTDLIHSERHHLADDLAGLDAAAWSTPSLCEGWTVEDVVAHLTQRNRLTVVGALKGAVTSGGLQRFIDAGVEAGKGATPGTTLAEFRATADLPAAGPLAREVYLGELVIHAEDIRRPLGITHLYPRDAVSALLRSRARLARKLTRGLSLVATDSGLVVGRGASVRGPAMSLLMVVSGRAAHLDDLTGPGVPALKLRLRAR